MKPLSALGLALVIVGALVAAAAPGLRSLAGALAICGVALVVYSLVPRRPRQPRGPFSWEDDEARSGPREIYTANPGEMRERSRLPTSEPAFTSPNPGTIRPPREQSTGGSPDYEAAPEPAPVPEPRPKEAALPEYSPPPGEVQPEPVARTASAEIPVGSLPGEDAGLPPMARPPVPQPPAPPPPPPLPGRRP